VVGCEHSDRGVEHPPNFDVFVAEIDEHSLGFPAPVGEVLGAFFHIPHKLHVFFVVHRARLLELQN